MLFEKKNHGQHISWLLSNATEASRLCVALSRRAKSGPTRTSSTTPEPMEENADGLIGQKRARSLYGPPSTSVEPNWAVNTASRSTDLKKKTLQTFFSFLPSLSLATGPPGDWDARDSLDIYCFFISQNTLFNKVVTVYFSLSHHLNNSGDSRSAVELTGRCSSGVTPTPLEECACPRQRVLCRFRRLASPLAII